MEIFSIYLTREQDELVRHFSGISFRFIGTNSIESILSDIANDSNLFLFVLSCSLHILHASAKISGVIYVYCIYFCTDRDRVIVGQLSPHSQSRIYTCFYVSYLQLLKY